MTDERAYDGACVGRAMVERAESDEGIQTARKYLSQAKTITNEIALMHARLQTLRERTVRVSSLSLAYAKSGGTSDTVGAAAQAITDLEREVLAAYERLTALEREISDTVERLGNAHHRMILRMRYIDGISFPAIATRLSLTEGHVFKLHRKALALVALILIADKNFSDENRAIF